MKKQLKVALVYDRINKWGGAERVLLVLHEIFPNAPLFTSVYSPKTAKWAKVFPRIIPSFLQKIPFANSNHELVPYLMPFAFESHNIDDYDLVISVTSEFSKGIVTKAKHICYCLTPTRYLWSGFNDYFKNPILRKVSQPLISYLRKWDKLTASRPDMMVAISTEVQKRIKKYYNRDSKIIFPPVEINKSSRKKKKDFYLIVSRLVSYKRVDLAIQAFNKLGSPLVIIGTGKEEGRIKRMAKNNIKFVKQLTDSDLVDYYRESKALVFPQEEDFGLVAVEAQVQGTPVIAYKKGGSLDTVIDGKTGVFFNRQTREDLIDAVRKFEKMKFKESVIKRNGKRFSKERFKKELLKLIKSL